MSYAPDWILNVVCAKVAERYVLGALPIEAYANRMSRDLLLTYADCTPEKLYSVAEDMLFSWPKSRTTTLSNIVILSPTARFISTRLTGLGD
jgi:hypothetical protein